MTDIRQSGGGDYLDRNKSFLAEETSSHYAVGSSNIMNGSNGSHADLSHLVNTLYTPLYIPVCVGLLNGIVFFTGIIGNSLVMLVVCRVKEMRSSTNYFLISLSAADALVLLICQPSAILEFYAQERWLLGPQVCKLVPFLENAVAFTSILTLLVISIERYVAICHPFAVHTTFTGRTTAKVVLAVWMLAFTISIPFMILTEEESATFHDGTPVTVCKSRLNELWHHVYLLLTAIVLFFIPMLVLIVLYTCIILKLRMETMKIGQCTKERRDRTQVIVILVSVIVLFFVCLMPVRVLTLWKIYTSTDKLEALGLEGYLNLFWFVRIMMYINSAGNPIIYNMVSTKFRNAFVRCLPFFKRGQRTGNSCHSSQPSFSLTYLKDYRDNDGVETTQMLTMNTVGEMDFMEDKEYIPIGMD